MITVVPLVITIHNCSTLTLLHTSSLFPPYYYKIILLTEK